MKITLDFDITNAKAVALLNYLKTLDFISISEDKVKLTNDQKQAIDIGLHDVGSNKTTSQQEVVNETRERYPKLFE